MGMRMRWAVALAAMALVSGAWAADTLVWVEDCQPYAGHDFALRLAWDEAAPGDVPIVLNVNVRGNDAIDNAYLTSAISDTAGNTVFGDRKNLLLDTGFRPYSFSWDASAVPNGIYTLSFSLKRPPALEVLKQHYTLRKSTGDELRAVIDEAAAHVAQVGQLAETRLSLGMGSPYPAMRAAFAVDMLDAARRALETGAVARAARLARYAQSAAMAALRESGAGTVPPEWNEMPETTATVRVSGAGFASEGRPRFLFGFHIGASLAPEMLARIVRYGTPFAVIDVPPAPNGQPEPLASFLDEAERQRVALLASLTPDAWTAGDWEAHKTAIDEASGRVNLADAEARGIMERHITATLPLLAARGNVAAVCLAEAPFLKFRGDAVKKSFLDTVKSQYADRAALNRSWKSLFADFDELEIGWNYVNPRYQDSSAYRYDWQTYHLSLAAQWAEAMRVLARSCAPELPVMIAAPDTPFASEEVAQAIDRESLAATMDASACMAGNTPGDLYYALGYPQQMAIYTLLRSFAPDKPLVNMALRLFDGDTWETPCSFAYAHTAAWEAAMAGLDAAGLVVPGGLMRPEGLEGYTAASIDLNRLAPIVTAFQNAPALVRVLFSASSKIYANGDPHLSSARFAFEGCSFAGYKTGYISEKQIVAGELKSVKVLVVPDTPAVSEAAFPMIKEYMQGDECVIRTSTSITFDERGHSRRDIITPGRRTIHVRGENLPAEYLHAMDGVMRFGTLPRTPRIVNSFGYVLEGVKSLHVEHEGNDYLYLVNLRKTAQVCHMQHGPCAGRDLIGGRDVRFPVTLEPLDPMLIRLDPSAKPDKPKVKHVRRAWERREDAEGSRKKPVRRSWER